MSATGKLYGVTAMSFNMHQFLHIPETARQMGPLWAHTGFVYEGGNDTLVKLVTGASAVPLQIVERVVMSQQLDHFLPSSLVDDHSKRLCRGMLAYKELQNFSRLGNVGLLGRPLRPPVTEEEKARLTNYDPACPRSPAEYHGFAFKGHIFHSRSTKDQPNQTHQFL